MSTSEAAAIVADHAEPGEQVRLAFGAYVNAGLARRIIGVTDRRLIVIGSGYFALSAKGLLWADPIGEVALDDKYTVWIMNGANTGNAYVRIRRADGSMFTCNPRDSFAGRSASAENNIRRLPDLIPGRF
jgi:hypothetical protein